MDLRELEKELARAKEKLDKAKRGFRLADVAKYTAVIKGIQQRMDIVIDNNKRSLGELCKDQPKDVKDRYRMLSMMVILLSEMLEDSAMELQEAMRKMFGVKYLDVMPEIKDIKAKSEKIRMLLDEAADEDFMDLFTSLSNNTQVIIKNRILAFFQKMEKENAYM